MSSILSYLAEMVLASGLLYAYYHFFLRNSRFHQYNRFYLLIATVLSLLVPLGQFNIEFSSPTAIPSVYQVLDNVRVGTINMPPAAHNGLSWQTILGIVYAIVSMLLLVHFLLALLQLRSAFLRNRREHTGKLTVIHTREKNTPYSFFNLLFWNDAIPMDSADGRKIFRHELFHIQQRHSWDIIYLQLLTTICWINPFFHLIKKETTAIHEFLADRFAVQEDNKWEYAELLIMQTLQTRQPLAHSFFHNQLKRRIAMITHSNNTRFQYLRQMMVLPVALLTVSVISVHCTADQTKNEQQPVAEQLDKISADKTTPNNSIIPPTTRIQKDIVTEEQSKEAGKDAGTQTIYTKVDIEADFKGGRDGWIDFLTKNLNPNVPVDKGAPEGTYTVLMQFLVDKNGRISDLKALTKNGYGMEEEALRVMRMSPVWAPAILNGKPVQAYRKQPITYVIAGE